MRKTHSDVSKKLRAEMIEILQHSLSTGLDLHSQIKQAHWNVRGVNFIALHKLFDDVAGDVLEYCDTLAERIVQFGGDATGEVRFSAKHSSLKPYPVEEASWQSHTEAVARGLAGFAEETRKGIATASNAGDDVTADIFTEVCRGTDKWLWMVESHMEKA